MKPTDVGQSLPFYGEVAVADHTSCHFYKLNGSPMSVEPTLKTSTVLLSPGQVWHAAAPHPSHQAYEHGLAADVRSQR
jgi:hypothetical protein